MAGLICKANADCTSSVCTAGRCRFTAAATTFAAETQYAFPASYCSAVTTADLDGDGALDLAALGSGGQIALYLGKGDGTFTVGPTYTHAANGSRMTAADYNSDGRPDLLFSLATGVQLRPNAGGGTLGAAMTTPIPMLDNQISALDMNGDGLADAAGASTALYVYTGDGLGGFKAAYSRNVGALLRGVALGDANGDSITDFIWVEQGINVPGQYGVLLGTGNGGFAAPVVTKCAIDQIARTVPTLPDFNNDGKADLAYFATPMQVHLGNGNGAFQAPLQDWNGAVNVVYGAAHADINGDGNPDILMAGNLRAFVLPGNGNGTFAMPVWLNQSWNNMSIAVGDFNGDGKPDIAMCEQAMQNNVGVYLNTSR